MNTLVTIFKVVFVLFCAWSFFACLYLLAEWLVEAVNKR